MAKKAIKVIAPEKCIGCELCVLALGRLKGKVGLSGSEIRILNKDGSFNIHLDPNINEMSEENLEKIVKICPRACFELSEPDKNSMELKFGEPHETGN